MDTFAERIGHPQDTAVPTKSGFRRLDGVGVTIRFLTFCSQDNTSSRSTASPADVICR